MTNRLAIYLGLFIGLLVALDLFLGAGQNLTFLARKLFDLIEWLAFWR